MFRRKEEELENQEQETAEKTEEKKETTSAAPAAAANSNNTATPANNAPASAPAKPAAQAEAKVAPLAAQPASAYRPAPTTPARPAAVNAPAANAAPAAEEKKRRVLTVGNDILLKGEIATCDRLVIEGDVDAKLNEVHTVEIAETGSFKGSAAIEDAEISGLFEGDLVVRNRLIIYSTGKVRGKITYGEIEIERGGELTGEIKTGTSAAEEKAKSKAA